MITNLPNLLTLFRIFVIPLMVAAFFLDFPVGNWIAFGLFAAASITDYFDGWLARAWNQVSPLGRFLDPVADKLLVASAILMLVAMRQIEGFAVIAAVVIMCREMLVSGLREFLA
ncbi:CDP-alcohol phosphatidyltransferase family protein, partial [Zavarzinia sp.]|uniref:CDP-alcohol phosphatidyltransferase family protein n=1 Tax=Zavarzinia sp. TaxID=2027920 RepID=UPI00356626FA